MTAAAVRPSVKVCAGTVEVCDYRVFGPGGEALARRFARLVLAFDEISSLVLDPTRATATLECLPGVQP